MRVSKLLYLVAVALALAGCCTVLRPAQPADLPVAYHNTQYGLTFFLPASWQGYSVLTKQWEGLSYSPAEDKQIVVGHGAMIMLRHPQWRASERYQDIPILVFTREQWNLLQHDKLWPSLYAGGVMGELWHTPHYVFAMSSRYNFADEVRGTEEVGRIIEENRNAHPGKRLYPE